MNRKDFNFYIGEDPFDNFKTFDCGVKLLRVVIHVKWPMYSETAFELVVASSSAIVLLEKEEFDFDQYIFFIKNEQAQPVKDYIKKLIDHSANQGDVWEKFRDYAFDHLEAAMCGPLRLEAAEELLYKPTMTWQLTSPQRLEEGATFYDEKVKIVITWPYENTIQTFTGYWFVTSVDFIFNRLETTDPYYRRFILVSHSFKADHLREELRKELRELITIQPTEREAWLKHRFEYPGQDIFYER